MTDLGRSTSVVEERLKECGSLIIEFNHDTQMLENGPYPLRLKRRIKGPEGHLSNSQASDLLAVLSHEKLKHVIVAHISRKNNIAEKAVEKARAILEVKKMENTEVIVSHQDYPIPMMEI